MIVDDAFEKVDAISAACHDLVLAGKRIRVVESTTLSKPAEIWPSPPGKLLSAVTLLSGGSRGSDPWLDLRLFLTIHSDLCLDESMPA